MSQENNKNLPTNTLSRNPFIRGQELNLNIGPTARAELYLPGARIKGVIVLESDIPCTASIIEVSNNKAVLTFSPVPEHLSSILPTSTVETANFPITLNGDTDGKYIIEGEYQGTGTWLRLRINDAIQTVTGRLSPLGATASSAITEQYLAFSSSSSQFTSFTSFIYPETGSTRKVNSSCHIPTLSNDSVFVQTASNWTDTSTNVVQLGVSTLGAGGFTENSQFHLSRLRRFTNNKVKVWIY